MFKIAISTPGIDRIKLFRIAEEAGILFPIIVDQDEDLFKTVKDNMFGGLIIIVKRYKKVGGTRIRGGDLAGYDVNSLFCQQ